MNAETIIVRQRRSWPRRLASELAALILALVLIAGVGVVLLDSGPGHRFLVDRIGKIETATGLRIQIASGMRYNTLACRAMTGKS